MAGKSGQLILLAACGLLAVPTVFAQDKASPAPDDKGLYVTPPPLAPKNPPGRGDLDETRRRAFERLSPEEREKFRENFQRWKNLPPEERRALRDGEQFRRQKIEREIDEALKTSGLQLDADRRQVFALRYTQERRKIEEQIRKEIEQKRKPLLEAVVARLKTEFSTASSPAPSTTPSSQ